MSRLDEFIFSNFSVILLHSLCRDGWSSYALNHFTWILSICCPKRWFTWFIVDDACFEIISKNLLESMKCRLCTFLFWILYFFNEPIYFIYLIFLNIYKISLTTQISISYLKKFNNFTKKSRNKRMCIGFYFITIM